MQGILISALVTQKPIQAQVTSDGTVSTDVTTPNNLDFTITNGQQVGGNLFHSFQTFSVPSGGSATFENGINIQNIFSRVTGNAISEIDGLIQTQGTANLFLLNPNGIIFGANAELNVGGSFIATTASQINFADGSHFGADPQTPPILTISMPIGLQFRETAANIINRSIVNLDSSGGGLEVPTNKTLALVGGNLLLEAGRAITSGGRIELGSIAAPALVSLIPIDAGWQLSYDGVQQFQDIHFSQNATVQNLLFSEGSGDITLQGREITFSGNANLLSFNLSDTKGGNMIIKASELVKISEDSNISTFTFGSGASGNITMETQHLVMVDEGASIDAGTLGEGRGGNIMVNATESIEIDADGGLSQITTQVFGEGDAGTIRVTTQRLRLRNGGQITTSTTDAGNGGEITINAFESIEASGQGTFDLTNRLARSGVLARTQKSPIDQNETTGNGGSITINTGRLVLENGASLSVGAIDESMGKAGRLTINASESITVSGINSSILATSEGTEGGNLTLNTPLLTVQQNATISASTQTGRGGNLTVNASELVQLSNNAILSVEASNGGTAGNLSLTTAQLNLLDGAKITVSGLDGQAGNINLDANRLFLNQGLITAETGTSEGADGANIFLNVSDFIKMENESLISATANGEADGGSIEINTPFLVVFPPIGADGSDIIATAQQGDGGRIIINAEGIFGIQEGQAISGNQTNDLDASSELGASGEIIISRELDPNQVLEQLPETVIDQNTLIAQNACKSGVESEFVVTGRGGLPPSLNEDLNSEATQVNLVEPAPIKKPIAKTTVNQPTNELVLPENSPVPAQGWVFNQKGEVVLVSYNPRIRGTQRLQPRQRGCISHEN